MEWSGDDLLFLLDGEEVHRLSREGAIFLGLTIFLVFPFTRLVHVWSVPVQYLVRSGYQIVRKRA